MSARSAAALVVAQLGVAAFFIAGVMRSAVGDSAGWFVLAATVWAYFARALDIESWALLVPGGFVGRVTAGLGPRVAAFANAAAFVERLLLGAIATVVLGQYLAGSVGTAIAGFRFTGYVRPEDLSTLLAVITIGVIWIGARLGRAVNRELMARGIWIGVGILIVPIVWGLITWARGLGRPAAVLLSLPPPTSMTPWSSINVAISVLVGLGIALAAVGSGEALMRVAHEFPPPRLHALRRTSHVSLAFAAVVMTIGTFLVTLLVPAAEELFWSNAPIAALAQHLAGPVWARDLVALGIAVAAALILVPAAHAAIVDAQGMVHRASADVPFQQQLASLNTRFGMPVRSADVTALAVVGAIVVSGGRISWLAHGYALAIAVMLVLAIAALVRLRQKPQERAVEVPINLVTSKREIPLGLGGLAAVAGIGAAALIFTGDGAAIATSLSMAVLLLWRTAVTRGAGETIDEAERDSFNLLLATDLTPGQVEARPGNVLVPVRNPHQLDHVAAALRMPGDRDVVIMTARLIDVDVSEAAAGGGAPTVSERRLLSEVMTLAERIGRPVRLLIVPARSVVDAIVGTAIRLGSSDILVGESMTLSAEDQARMLGEAWERADKPEAPDVRLVIHHRSGRFDTYHLGAHPPSLSPRDLDLIHRVWLDATKAIGPHVHHHDVVRAALTIMEQQLSGPERDAVLAAIRDIARPAEELATVLRTRDYARLRDMLRNRHAGDVATLLTALTVEDQAVVFRVLPRGAAADIFEYLSHDAKAALLRALAQEEVAALLNNMAPDDRTMFLEELPASATRELLTLLTPKERAVALTLLGYPEKSVGRLMTPNYLAASEAWTVRETLDYVRAHGEDSETLNHIYVVDPQGVLIDDIRIREFLLAPLDKTVAELMDRRFIALKATDSQEAAVAVFREYDRGALPVTDTAGVLIGIVTIDDVLDVAEATATREIQRIGGSEALDEPYISIAFWKMIQKRAGWLTALFLGEMLTATA
ncbi:MAG TPA: CBS domain-containing protein, partial [Vicinamibacterales bacterium]|nr:CBS domain-containing protein [Vicinamibacterales bacterium]